MTLVCIHCTTIACKDHGLINYFCLVKVVGFYHKAPLIQFEYRQGQLLNLCGEKTTEKMIYMALQLSLKDTGIRMVDYTCIHHTNIGNSDKPRYYLLLEAEECKNEHKGVLSMLLDKYIGEQNKAYEYCRKLNTLDCAEVMLVQNGTFQQLSQYIRAMNGSPNQVKVPRLLCKKELIEFVLGQVR